MRGGRRGRRRGRGALVLVALLAALVGGVVGTAAAGARRTVTADDRLTAVGREPDGLIFADNVDPATYDRIRDLPSVDVAGEIAYSFIQAHGLPGDYPWFTSVDGVVPERLARGRLVAGRAADPDSTDEVALAEPVADRLGLGLGDVLHLDTFTPEQIPAFIQGEQTDPEGPPLDLTVVGITRSSQDVVAKPGDPVPGAILNPGIYERYQDEIGFGTGVFLFDLAPGATLEDVADDLRAAYPDGEPPNVDPAGFGVISLDDSLGTLAGGLWIFAGVLGLFGLVAVAQAVGRTVARREPEQLTLAALGMTRRARFLDAWRPLVGAAVVGALGALALAVVGSSRMPIGLARRVEPDLGVDLDGRVLAAVVVGTFAVVAGAGALSAWRLAARPVTRPATARPVRRAGLGHALVARRPTASIGLGMAAASGGPETVAVRTALVGIGVAVAGIAAVAVVGASMSRLVDDPVRYGWGWDAIVRPETGLNAEALATRDDVVAVARSVQGQTVEVDGRALTAMAFDVVRGEIGPTIIDGRAPTAPDEVALGADTRDTLGDPATVTVRAADRSEHQFRVVGTMVMPSAQDPIPVAEGALFAYRGLQELGLAHVDPQSPGIQVSVVRFADGIDPREALAPLLGGADPSTSTPTCGGGTGGCRDAVRFPEAPSEVQRLEQVDSLPRLLAAFLGGLAVLAVGNALWQTVQRRRRELAVLRALGFDRGQVRASVGWQSLALSVVGTAIGLPLGLVVGRWVWELIADRLGVASDPLTPLSVTILAVATVALAVVAGLVFGAIAARRPPSVALREA